jgi:hypothetical protein
MAHPFESDYAESLRALDRVALLRLWGLLQDDSATQRDQLMRDLIRMPPSVGAQLLGQLVAMCDTDRFVRLEVLRGIRDALEGDTASGPSGP